MCCFRDVLLFLAGFEFFHTLSHALLPYFVNLPLHTRLVDITLSMNYWAIGINGVITLLLLWAVCRLGKKKHHCHT